MSTLQLREISDSASNDRRYIEMMPNKRIEAKHDSHWSRIVIFDLQSFALTSRSFSDLPFLYDRMGGVCCKTFQYYRLPVLGDRERVLSILVWPICSIIQQQVNTFLGFSN